MALCPLKPLQSSLLSEQLIHGLFPEATCKLPIKIEKKKMWALQMWDRTRPGLSGRCAHCDWKNQNSSFLFKALSCLSWSLLHEVMSHHQYHETTQEETSKATGFDTRTK